MSFYITLPSNSSMELYPQNTLTDFSVQLIEPLRLDIKYEVALVELTYKHSWTLEVGKLVIKLPDSIEIDEFNLVYHDGENIASFTNRLNSEILEYYIEKEYLKRYMISTSNEEIPDNIKIPTTHYDSLTRDQAVVNEINKSLIDNIPQFRSERYRIYIYIPNNQEIKFEGKILNILNLQSIWYKSLANQRYINSGVINDPNPNFIQSLFIYCDIIDYQYVGDAFVPLLRNVIVDNQYLKTAWVHYDNPHYVCINKSQISTIKVEIRDETGQKIKFENGKIILKLHFRPIK